MISLRTIAFLPLIFLIKSSTLNTSAKLVVTITGLKNEKGVIEIGLFSDPKKFPTPNKQFKKARVKIDDNKVKYQFEDLPLGQYALAVYHDENNDNVCNRNFFGIPTEAYCFSRDFKPFLSAPDWSDCYIQLNSDRAIEIKMIY